MKTILLNLLIIAFFTACTNTEITRDDCKKEGKVFKSSKVLNFRTGDYEIRKECVER